jgi:ATP synthase protein I
MVDPRETKPSGAEDPKRSVTGELEQRIRRAKGARPVEAASQQGGSGDMTGAGRGFRLASEFVAAVIVGAGLGFGFDRLFGTQPWGMIVLLLLGFAAGVLNVIRATAEMNSATAVPAGTPPAADDDDE